MLQNPMYVTHNWTVLTSDCLGLFQYGVIVQTAILVKVYFLNEFLQEKNPAYEGKMIILYIFNRNHFPPSMNRYWKSISSNQKLMTVKFSGQPSAEFGEVRPNSLAIRHLWPLGSLAFLTPITSGSQFSLCPISLLQKPHFSFYYTASGKRKALRFLFFPPVLPHPQ